MTATSNGRLQPGFRRTADSLSCTRSAVPRSIRAPGTASPRRWASMPRGRSAPIPRCSIRPPSSRENAQSIPRILAESSLRGRESTRPMRWTAVLLAFVLALPAAVALIRLPPTEHWETPPDVGPLLMPPNPTMGTWPPYLRRQAPGPMPIPAKTTGVARIVVLLIDFTDIAHDPSHDGPYFDARMNAAGSSAHSVGSYYQEVSRGALTVNATVIPMWFHSTHPMSDYGADRATGVDDANGPIYRLVTEAVRAADATANFAQFDTNGDGVVDHLMVVHAGAGQESSPSNKDLIWSHRWAVLDADPTTPGSQSQTADGVQIYGYTMESEDFVIGTVAHEFGHDLGLPDLYDTDGSSAGAGIWDIMSLGSWNGAPARRPTKACRATGPPTPGIRGTTPPRDGARTRRRTVGATTDPSQVGGSETSRRALRR